MSLEQEVASLRNQLAQVRSTLNSLQTNYDNHNDEIEQRIEEELDNREAVEEINENHQRWSADPSNTSDQSDPASSTSNAAPDAPSDPDENYSLPELPAAPGTMGGYPRMADPGTNPGFTLGTAGNEYKWIGGDHSKVVVGDSRSIVGGEEIKHVNGARLTRIGGHMTNEYFSGTKTTTIGLKEDIIEGNMRQRYTGNSHRVIIGNETREMEGNRHFTIDGDRFDKIKGLRNDIVVGCKWEEITINKSELVGGVKAEYIIGAKISMIDGCELKIGKATTIEKLKNSKIIAGKKHLAVSGLFFSSAGKEKKEVSESITTEAPQVINKVDKTKQKGELTVDKKLKTKDSASIGNGTLKVDK